MSEFLTELGYKFTEQVQVGSYVVDFVLEDGTFVEAYGWHHEKLNKKHDKKKEAFLRKRSGLIILWWHSEHLWWQEFLQVQ